MERVIILVYEKYVQCFSGSELGNRTYVEVPQGSFYTALTALPELPIDEEAAQYGTDRKRVIEQLECMPADYFVDPFGYTYPKTTRWGIRLYAIQGYKTVTGELLVTTTDAHVD